MAGGQGKLTGSTRFPHPSSPSKNPQIWRWLRPGESGGFSRPVGGGIGANTVAKNPPVTPHFEAVGITRKPKKAEGSPESRKAFWGEEEQRNE